jgi:alcohol dehydrogenase
MKIRAAVLHEIERSRPYADSLPLTVEELVLDPPGDGEVLVEIKHVSLVAEERCVMGSYIGSCVPLRDIPRYVALHETGRSPIKRLMSGHIGLDDINAAFDKLADGSVVRQVVSF